MKKGQEARWRPNICQDCQKACGGCSWSELDETTGEIKFQPVPGWTATKVILKAGNGGRKHIETYHITACPEFVPDEPRTKKKSYEISDDAFNAFLKKWRLLEE